MKKLIALCALLLSFASQATVVRIELDKAAYLPEELVQATVKVSGYTDGLAGFQLNLSYLLSKLSLQSVTFGPHFSPFEPNETWFSQTGGKLTLAEMNYLDFAEDLAAIQGDEFTLVTLSFKVLQSGLHKLTLSNLLLTDAFFGSTLDDVSVENAVVNSDVPAPATALLLLPALLWLGRRQRG